MVWKSEKHKRVGKVLLAHGRKEPLPFIPRACPLYTFPNFHFILLRLLNLILAVLTLWHFVR